MSQDFLPEHLRDDAPCQKCDRCGRKTWDRETFEGVCGMPQRSSAATGKWIDPCQGRFRSEVSR